MLNLKDYNILIPEHLIALKPSTQREMCKLLYYDYLQKESQHLIFNNILSHIHKNDVLVINNTKVDPSRLYLKDYKNHKHEVLVVHKIDDYKAECKIKGRRKLNIGDVFTLEPDVQATLLYKYGEDKNILLFSKTISSILENHGELALPQYIINKRPYKDEDKKHYQTVFADKGGSKAAPTAGLHFSEDLIGQLIHKGVQIVPIQLFVSLGTFHPIQSDSILDHHMHEERYFLSPKTVQVLNLAIQNRSRIIAVGTTSLRTLESNFNTQTNQFKAGEFNTNLFIKPGYQLKTVNSLITNFHTPYSTLLVLIASLIGYEEMRRCYQTAIEQEYRFFSYGDACFFDNLKS